MLRSSGANWRDALTALYGSAVDEGRYVDFLDQTQQLIGSRFLVLGMFDPHDPGRHVHRFAAPTTIGVEGAATFLGLAAESHADGSDSMLAVEPQRVLLDKDVYDDRDALDQRPTMKHLRETYDATHIGVVNAQANGAWVDYMMFAHNDAEFGDPEGLRALVGELAPHIGVASEIRRAFRLLEQRYQAVFAALNHLRYGVALILDNGEMLLCNATFDAMLAERDGLRLAADRRLRCADARAEDAFENGLRETLAAARGRRRDYRKTVSLPRANGATSYILDFAPFTDEVSGELNVNIEGALLFLVDPEQSSVISHQGLSTAFGLTTAENVVCRQVLDGRSNSEIAETNGTALPTVKSQVSSIFAKTRVSDRAGLMRLASKVSPPLAESEDNG